MKHKHTLYSILVLSLLFTAGGIRAQSGIRGAVLRKGTSTRVGNALILNKRLNLTVLTDNLGLFSIVARLGDTLEIAHPDYINQKVSVTSYSDLIVHLQTDNVLREVVVKGTSPAERLVEVENSFRKKGIYYKGRPPLRLLSPFGGSPLTFFYEILSKDGKRARRFGQYAQSEADYYEVAARFNDYNIKKVIPIKDEDLPEFKRAFWPTAEQVRTWNEFDLLNYIKISFAKFKSSPPSLDSLRKATE